MIRRAATTLMILFTVASSFAQQPKQVRTQLDNLLVNPPTNWVGTDLVRSSLLDAGEGIAARSAFQAFESRSGGTWTMFYDRATGQMALVEGSGLPWIAGAGNDLARYENGRMVRGEAAATTPVEAMVERSLAFVETYPDLFGVRREDLTVMDGATGPMLDYLYFVHLQWNYHGIPVEHAQVLFRLNHGNLVQFGTEFVSDSITNLEPVPNVTLKQAWGIIDSFTHGEGADNVVEPGRLLVMPVSVHPVLDPAVEGAAPIAYRMVWALSFRRPGVMGTWEARVDAHTGEIVSFKDGNDYGSIQGGTYTTDKNPTQTEITLPFGFGDYQPNTYADAGGLFPGNTGTCTLSGKYVDINDTCGSISLTANGSGLIDFGSSSGTNCTTPGVGGNGNTHASRTQYWNLNAIKAKARTYLPSNGWLTQQLRANVNINSACNAYWDGTSVNFFHAASGCGNTGELVGVSMHEWGHGMDQNDGMNPSNGGSGESYGDVTAVLQTHESCMGGGFLGGNCGGYGNACLSCTGVRDIDYAKHANNTPSTVGNWPGGCGGGGGCSGPCGSECHCESLISSEALWDLANRDLITWGLDQTTAWQVVDRLWYASRPTAGSFYACGNNTSCSASNMFAVFRVVDDCDGNLSNGTPHATAIFNAFNRHQIACTSVTNTDNNCSCANIPAPTATGTPGNNQNTISWAAVAGAASYDVFRNEVSCTAGFTLIGNTASLSYTDTTVVNGFTYYYRVQARSATTTCPASVMSNCVTLTPASGPFAEYVSGSAAQTADTGDNDGFPDNCEDVTVGFQIRNIGVGSLTNVRVTGLTSTSSAVTLLTSLPINLGSLGTGQTASASFIYSVAGATCGGSLPFNMTVTADQMTTPSAASFSFTSELDATLVPLLTYSFESNLDGWTVQTGTFTRTNTYGGSAGSFAMASSANLDDQCDVVRSPVFQPTATTTMTVGTHYDIEPFSSGQWWDRANFGVWDGATRTVVQPTGGRTYNASGTGGTCSLDTDPGWADAATTWADATGFNLAPFAGTNVQLDVTYGTDAAANGTGFHFDNVRVTNVMAQTCDAQPDSCGSNPTTMNYLVGEGLGQSNSNGVKVYRGNGTATAVSFLAYAAGQWGTNVAAGDVNGGSSDEILTGPGPGPVYGPQVRGFDRTGTSMGKVNFYAYGTLKYGVNVAGGNVDGDGYDEIVSGAGPGAVFGPHVRGWNFDGGSISSMGKINFFAYSTLKFGVNVAGGNVDGDAYGELLTGPGPGAIFGPQVRGFNYDASSVTAMAKINFNAFALSGYGVNVAGGNFDGDGFAEIATAAGPGPSHPANLAGFQYDNASISAASGFTITPYTSLYGARVGLGDVTGNGRWELITGPGRASGAPAQVRGYAYSGSALSAVAGTPFTAFTGTYGVNVAGADLDY